MAARPRPDGAHDDAPAEAAEGQAAARARHRRGAGRSLFRIFTPPLSLDDDFGDASGGYGEAEAAAGVAPGDAAGGGGRDGAETRIPHATAYYLKSMAGSDGFEEEDDDGYGDRHLAHIFGPGILKDELEMPDGFEPEAPPKKPGRRFATKRVA